MMKRYCLLAAFLLCSLVFTASASAETPAVPKGLVLQADGKLLPGPGYAWVTQKPDDLRVRWVPRMAHPTQPNIFSGDKENNWTAAAGYKWLNDTPGDLRVVKVVAVAPVAQNGLTEAEKERLAKAALKAFGAAVAHQASKPQDDDGILEAIARGISLGVRDKLIDSALEDVFINAKAVERDSLRNLVVLALDKKLSKDRDTVLRQLRRSNPDMADAVQAVEFLIVVGQLADR